MNYFLNFEDCFVVISLSKRILFFKIIELFILSKNSKQELSENNH